MDWEFLFSNKSGNQQVITFNGNVVNFYSNFVPNKFVTFNDRDPPWTTSIIKDKINYNNRKYLKKAKQQVDYIKLQKRNKGIIRININ